MKQARIIIFNLFVYLLMVESHADVAEQRKAELLLALGRDRNERVDNLPSDEKRWLLEYIRNQRKVPGWAAAYELQLLQLGDEETMERYLSVFDEYPENSYEIGASRQPRLIERMARTMFHDEPAFFPQTADVYIHPRSINAARIVARVLSTSNEIPDAVRRWAADILTASDTASNPDLNGKMRSAMRQWWRDNENAMRAQNWAGVKPGVEVAVQPGGGKRADPLGNVPGAPGIPGVSDDPQRSKPASSPAPSALKREASVSYTVFGFLTAIVAAILIAFRDRLLPKK